MDGGRGKRVTDPLPVMLDDPCQVGMWSAVDPLGIGEASGRYAKSKWMVTSSLTSPPVDKAPVTARAFQITRVHIIGFVAPSMPAIFRFHTDKLQYSLTNCSSTSSGSSGTVS
jgi:hypothetical protein